jgi:hypothetical protein
MDSSAYPRRHPDHGLWMAPGHPRYLVNDLGEIFRITKSKGLVKAAVRLDRVGYPTFRMKVGNVRKSRKVHKFALLAFTGTQPSPYHVVRHLDDVKTNNTKENLCWGTSKENIADAIRNGRRKIFLGSNSSQAILNEQDVLDIRLAMKNAPRGYASKLAKAFGVNSATIWAIDKRKNWKHL